MLVHAIIKTDWGYAGLVGSRAGVCGVCLPEKAEASVKRWLRESWPQSQPDSSLLAAFGRMIEAYFAGKLTELACDVDLSRVSAFDQKVLRACRRIGYGERMTYGDLARAVGRPKAARAVGGVMSRNPIPLVVPCHRVVAADGSLCGFSASQGTAMKKRLLDWESLHRRLT